MAHQRDAQRDATRARILHAAVETLLELGYSGTSTVAVQQRAGVSRGALLHHFPSRGALFGALVSHLVQANESAVRDASSALGIMSGDVEVAAVRGALGVLYDALARPAFQAELELWAAARTEPELREVLRSVESEARRDLRRVLDALFGPTAVASPRYRSAVELTAALLRGLVLALPLRGTDRTGDLLDEWARLLTLLLRADPEPSTADRRPGEPL